MTLPLQETAPQRLAKPWQILVVDDEMNTAEQCSAALQSEGHTVRTARSAGEALASLRGISTDLVLTGLTLPDVDGMRLLAQVRELYPDTEVVVVADSEAIETALEAMRRGAADFLLKPFDLRELKRITSSCLTALRASRDKNSLGHGQSMLEMWQMVSNAQDVRAVPAKVVEMARHNFDADAAVLLSYSAAQDDVSVLAHAGMTINHWGAQEPLAQRALEAIRQGRVVFGADVNTADCYIYAPLVAGGKPRGALCLRRSGGPWFYDHAAETLQIYATHVALALEALSMYDVAGRQVAELEELADASRSLSDASDTESLCAKLLAGAGRAVAADMYAVLVIRGDEECVQTRPTLSESSLRGAVRDRLAAAWGAAPNQAPVADRDAVGELQRRFASLVYAPLTAGGRQFGILAAFTARPGGFSVEVASRLASLAESAAALEGNRSRLAAVSLRYQETLDMLGRLVDARCPQHEGHSLQVRAFAGELARKLGISGADLYAIEDGGLLHDIGKISVPDAILGKPGRLTPEEFAVMAAHPVYGARILAEAPHLEDLAPIVRHHHEQFDGRGYPDGISGQAIPLGARIVALADVFDALISHRVYRPAIPMAQARHVVAERSGSHFDPELVRVFLRLPLENMVEH